MKRNFNKCYRTYLKQFIFGLSCIKVVIAFCGARIDEFMTIFDTEPPQTAHRGQYFNGGSYLYGLVREGIVILYQLWVYYAIHDIFWKLQNKPIEVAKKTGRVTGGSCRGGGGDSGNRKTAK